jgi:hypothetical protein
MSAWDLMPEKRMERAQEAQRGVVSRLRAILERDAVETMGADELEVMALQLQLAACNLRTSAGELRRCEEERWMLITVREREARRFEREPEVGQSDNQTGRQGDGEAR